MADRHDGGVRDEGGYFAGDGESERSVSALSWGTATDRLAIS